MTNNTFSGTYHVPDNIPANAAGSEQNIQSPYYHAAYLLYIYV